MTPLRDHLRQHCRLAVALILLALMMRFAVPAGFMPNFTGGAVSIDICTGHGPATVTLATPGPGDHQGDKSNRGKGEMPCSFSGLSTHSLAAADPILLAVAILFATAILRHLVVIRLPAASARLRPPPRGPPARA